MDHRGLGRPVNLAGLGFVDVTNFSAAFVAKHRATAGERLLLDEALLAQWKSARALLTRLSSAAAPLLGGKPAEILGAQLVTVHPGAAPTWRRFDDDEMHQVWLGVIAAPGYRVMCGLDAGNLPVGQALLVNHREWHSEINFGPVAQVNLVVDVARDPAD